jgi:hypothetical protein
MVISAARVGVQTRRRPDQDLRNWTTLGRRATAASGHEREENNVPDTDPIGWRGVIYGTPVRTADGAQAGTVREVLGSDAEDIFHGLRVRLATGRRDVMVLADSVTGLSHDAIDTDLSRSAIEALPTYDEVSTYHLASVGWLRKHLGWRKDSASDEEPG